MDTTPPNFLASEESRDTPNPSDSQITLIADLSDVFAGVCKATEQPEQSVGSLQEDLRKVFLSSELSRAAKEEDVPVHSGARCWISAQYDVLAPLVTEVDVDSRHLLLLALAIAYLQRAYHWSVTVTREDLTILWKIIYDVLANPRFNGPLPYKAPESYIIPLCILPKEDGDGHELYRLQFWLPDGERDSNFNIQSHEAAIQTWILAGDAKYCNFDVESTNDLEYATHDEYQSVDCLDRQGSANLNVLALRRTEQFMRIAKTNSSVHTINTSNCIEPGTWRSIEVTPDSLHAGIFLVDTQNEPYTSPRILAPKNIDPPILSPETDTTSSLLASAANSVRQWEMLFHEGKSYSQQSEMENALRCFTSAFAMCDATTGFPNTSHYARLVHGELGFTNRCLGRYDLAQEHLEEALKRPGFDSHRIKASGELGTVLRIKRRLLEARTAFENQYDIAKTIGDERAACRAIGNVGMVNYQLFQQSRDPKLLELAIEQLKERVDRARQIKQALQIETMNPMNKIGRLKLASIWESVGLNRLSLCYTAQGNMDGAIMVAKKSQDIEIEPKNPTVTTMSQFFYGRALLRGGKQQEAMKHLDPTSNECTPAIALCKESSEENRQYLQELVEVGVKMDRIDEYGYSALDYAEFGGDVDMEKIVIEGLRETLGGDVEAEIVKRQYESRLRKSYRELFHDKMRPVLLKGGPDTLKNLRSVYADALAGRTQGDTAQQFDTLKYVQWSDFLRCGRLPRHGDLFTKESLSEEPAVEFIIFFSYRWIGKEEDRSVPDDGKNTQYHRMVHAITDFLKLHPTMDAERLGIWLDYACIDQAHPKSGVAALPLLLAQCNAVISIVDNEEYYTRAWCALEIVMIQTLEKSYQQHKWYEYAPVSGRQELMLRSGPLDLSITATDKSLTVEEDRPKIAFLERQTQLLR